MAFERNLLIISIFIVFGTLASQATSRKLSEASIAEKHEQWMQKFGRVYPDSAEKERRLAIFKKNVEFVEKFNSEENRTYKLSINAFSDRSHEEFLRHRTGYRMQEDTFSDSTENQSFRYQSLSDVQASMDWRDKGAVTPIKDQQRCGEDHGDKSANKTMAKKFYDGLLQKPAKGEGTPLRKNKDIEVYLFGLFDEDLKSIAPGDFEHYWGIFRFYGQPKFSMDLSGKGPGTQMLHAVKGVQYLDQQWCVLKSDVKNLSLALVELQYACSQDDCTSLGSQRSCDLDTHGKASYAFNAYFQNKDQDHRVCDFNGMAAIVEQNPSKEDCWF